AGAGEHGVGVAEPDERAEDPRDVLAKRDGRRQPLEDGLAVVGEQRREHRGVVRRERLRARAELLEERACLGLEALAEVEELKAHSLVARRARLGGLEEGRARVHRASTDRTGAVVAAVEAMIADDVAARVEDVGGAGALAAQAGLAVALEEV